MLKKRLTHLEKERLMMVENKNKEKILYTALNYLKPEYKIIIEEKYLQRKPVKKIAKHPGKSHNATRSLQIIS